MTRYTRRGALGLMAASAATPALAKYGEPFTWTVAATRSAAMIRSPILPLRKPSRGSLEHAYETEDGTWLFSRADNLSKFRAAPQKYMPQFGGYCAQGIASGYKRMSDPTLWVLIDGKIYLHYSIPEQNRWALDIRGNITRAEEAWPGPSRPLIDGPVWGHTGLPRPPGRPRSKTAGRGPNAMIGLFVPRSTLPGPVPGIFFTRPPACPRPNRA